MRRIHVYDFSNVISVCLQKGKRCIDFYVRPFAKREWVAILVHTLTDWKYDVILYTDAEDLSDLVTTRTLVSSKQYKSRIKSFDSEGVSRIHRLLAHDPMFFRGVISFYLPEELYPSIGSYKYKVMEKRLGRLLNFCKKGTRE